MAGKRFDSQQQVAMFSAALDALMAKTLPPPPIGNRLARPDWFKNEPEIKSRLTQRR
jgi:hypothetical protein